MPLLRRRRRRPNAEVLRFRDAIRQWREIGCWWDLALCELDFVRFVGGENPDAKAAADEARDIFTRLGAPAFLRRLNEAVGLPVG